VILDEGEESDDEIGVKLMQPDSELLVLFSHDTNDISVPGLGESFGDESPPYMAEPLQGIWTVGIYQSKK
jgi:hypothetical protein